MPLPPDEVVAAALATEDPAEACRRMLDTLRDGLAAEQAMLAHGAGGRAVIIAHRSSAGAKEPLEIALLPALGTDQPVVLDGAGSAAVLAVGLALRDAPPWCVALARPHARPWTANERDALARLRPLVTLVVENAVARQRLADERARHTAAMTARERLVSVLAHELRNPLAPILMWTSTLKRLRKDDPEVLRATQAIDHAVSIERRLIEDLLDVSRLERGVLTLQRRPMDLRDEVRRMVDLHRTQADEAHVTITLDVPADPVPIEGDSARLGQVIGNLLGNAIKFVPAEGRIGVRLQQQGARAVLSVSDSGPGLPAEVRETLFRPFVQGPNARGGLGVGLAVARWLVDLHGGAIEGVGGGEHGGATFQVSIPLATDPPR
jgi:signal transduction histidine kinase